MKIFSNIPMVVSFYLVNCAPKDCEINPFKFQAPLIIVPGTTTVLNPQPGLTTIKLSKHEYVEFSCPESEVTVNGVSLDTTVIARCNSDSVFDINEKEVSWNDITCKNEPKPSVREVKTYELNENDPNINCFKKEIVLKILRIGFAINPNRFLGIIDICFNTADKVPIYSHFNVSSSTNSRVKTPNVFFEQDDKIYKSLNVNYLFKNVQNTVNQIVGLDYGSEKYVNGRIFINRGHLAAKADFIYEPFQKATFRYINVAPQWSSFNGGNWNQAEIDVRNYADREKVDLKVWTGTYGYSVLINEVTLAPKRLFLNINDNRNVDFPVPAVFWKMVYEPRSRRGIILVGHNNPYEEVTNDDRMLCERDLSNQVSWLHWDDVNIEKGYSYACAINDRKFLNLVPFVPRLDVKGLLI